MSKYFHKLRVSDIRNTTDDCVVIAFDIPDNLREIFKYKQGQHLVLSADIDGQEIHRSYSLCSAPADGEWKIAVKKIPGGRFSGFANDILSVGDHIDVMAPDGRFFRPINIDAQKNYVAFAAGSGITPIISIIKTHLQAETHSTFKLFYINKNSANVILKEELEALKNQFIDRFELYYFMTRQDRDIELFNGRIDEAKLDIIFKSIVDKELTDDYFLCGPEDMIFLVRDYLLEHGTNENKIHFELFNTSTEKKEKAIQEKTIKYEGLRSKITIKEGGKTSSFEIGQGSDNILDAALKNAADLPFACKGGVCCTCKAKLLEGQVDMIVNYGLEEEEIKEGYILTCQAVPVSENIVVDFDA